MGQVSRLIWQAGLAVLLVTLAAHGEDALLWRTNQDRVEVDIKDWNLPKVLQKISAATGWRVFLEPGTKASITEKFKNLSTDEALRRLLGQVNYARNESNGVSQLLVFRTVAGAATERVEAPKAEVKEYRIPNELIVRLKRNATESIEDIAKALGAKIVGRDDRLKLYRLQFTDEASAAAADAQLAADPSVGLVDNNYVVERPNPVQANPMAGGNSLPSLDPKAPVNGPIVGLVDTAVQMQDQFKPYSLTPLSVVGQPDPSATDITHGTSMFETLLEGMSQAPSKILPVDIYGSGETTTTYEVAEGIIAAVNAGANPINLSLGGTDDSMLRSLIGEATQKGILFVAASGNTPGDALTYPASYPGVLAVTASSSDGQLAPYANDGSFVKAMEPGTSIVYLNGQGWMVEGKSTATAFATSAIAQIMNLQHVTLSQAVSQFTQANPPPRRQ